MKHLLSLLLAITLMAPCQAQEEYQHKSYQSELGTLNYRILEPESFDSSQKYPLVLFLHGAGERGSDNQKQLTHGSQMFLNPIIRQEYPAFVLFPQCPEGPTWNLDQYPESFSTDLFMKEYEPTARIQMLIQMVDSMRQLPYVDENRIYIMGLSMGAMATYELTWRYPERFAAAVPICGALNPEKIERAAQIPFRIYHGDNDNVVPVQHSRNAYKALTKANAIVEYFEFPGWFHDSWIPAFNDTELIPWLFNQSK